jgi:hypothetical protein
VKRRAFISMLVGGAGALVLPAWRTPERVIFLPEYVDPLSYRVTRKEIADKLYASGFGLAPIKSEGGIILYDPRDAEVEFSGHSLWSIPHPTGRRLKWLRAELSPSSLEPIEIELAARI